MGFWRWITGEKRLAPAQLAQETKSVDVAPDLWAAFAGGWGVPTKAGTEVSASIALQVPTFYRGVMVIADGITQLPVEIYRRLPSGRDSELATDHPLYDLLLHRASDLQDAFQFFTTVLMHAVATGDSVSYKVVVADQVRELIPIRPENCEVALAPGLVRKQFSVAFETGQSAVLDAGQVFHLAGPSWRPFKGLDPALVGREAIGLARATEESQARLHSNGVRPGGILATEQKIDRTQVEMLREQWQQVQGGLQNAAADPEKAVPTIVNLVKARIPQRFGFDPIRDIQVLCPMNRGGVGARALNVKLQSALNPAGERKVQKFGWTFAPADKVMQIENERISTDGRWFMALASWIRWFPPMPRRSTNRRDPSIRRW